MNIKRHYAFKAGILLAIAAGVFVYDRPKKPDAVPASEPNTNNVIGLRVVIEPQTNAPANPKL